MTQQTIATLVEGQSETRSVPVLLRRLFARWQRFDLVAALPFRVKRYQIVREGELERAIRFVVQDRANVAGILVILDADDDCPAELGPELLARGRYATSLPLAVVLANREFEAWFLGAKRSLRGVRGIREDATAPSNPESVRGAKERLSANMAGRRYIAIDDQPALAARMDIDLACRNSPSFRKLVRDVEGLIAAL